MIPSPSLLEQIRNGHPVGEVWPYRGGSATDIHEHLRKAAEALGQGPLLEAEADFIMLMDDARRSGMVHCVRRREGPNPLVGITVFLSAFAPLAAYCPMTILQKPRSRGRLLHLTRPGETPSEDWSEETRWLTSRLEELGFAVPSREQLSEALSIAPEIPKPLRGLSRFNAIFL